MSSDIKQCREATLRGYYQELCPNEPDWVHDQLTQEWAELEAKVTAISTEKATLREHIIKIRQAWSIGTEDDLSEAILNASSVALATVEGKK